MFLDEFSDLLEQLASHAGHVLITGDFNFHVDDTDDNDATAFKTVISAFDLRQHVQQRTHRNGHTLDLVLSRSNDPLLVSVRSEDHGFPDHYPVFMEVCIPKPALPRRSVSYRRIKAIDSNQLRASLSNLPLRDIHNDLTLQQLVERYDSELSSVLDQHAPEKKALITVRPDAEWYNDSIREAKQERRRVERQWRRTKLTVHREIFIDRRTRVNELIDAAKVDHYKTMINDCQDNTRQLFRVVNKLLGRKTTPPLPFDDAPIEVATMFSDFFIQKITRIKDAIQVSADPTPPLDHVRDTLGVFPPVTEDEIRKLIAMSATKSCDLDPMPSNLVKIAAEELTPIITSIVNKSLSTGQFPAQYKTARVIPLLKKSSLDPNNLNNYRPVSNLAFVSKLLEKAVATRLNTYLSEKNLLEANQSAYRQGHSTETALLYMQNEVLHAIGSKKAVLFVMLDLSAAFDTVDHGLLMTKLQQLGVVDTAAKWLSSYIENRKQVVTIKGHPSEPQAMDCGVPQGSVLGPLLFTLYTASLGQLLRSFNVRYQLYADDTQMWLPFHPSNLDNAINEMERCIHAVHQWMGHHRLKLNCAKTEFLIIASPHASRSLSSKHLTIDNQRIEPSASARNLGVHIDTHASLEKHVSSISRSCFMYIHNINKIKKHLDFRTMEKLIHSFVTSKLDYCNSLLFGLPSKHINRIQRIQNVAARILTDTARHEHITPVLKELHCMATNRTTH